MKQKVVKIDPATSNSDLPSVTLENGQIIEPKLLVGSDGAKSMTRNGYGIETTDQSYG